MSDNIEITTPHKPDIEPAKPGQTNIISHIRDIHTYPVTDSEIDDLCSGYMSVDFGFFTLSIGVFISFIVTLVTTQMSDRVFATFVAITVIAFVGIIVFGIKTRNMVHRVKQRSEQIKGKDN